MVLLKVHFLHLEPEIMEFKELNDFQQQLNGEWLKCGNAWFKVSEIIKYEIIKSDL